MLPNALSALETAYQTFRRDVTRRVSHRADYAWLLSRPAAIVTDYLHLEDLGEKPYHQLNALSARLSPAVWRRWVFPRILNQMFAIFRTLHLGPRGADEPTPEFLHSFVEWLRNEFLIASHGMHHVTFAEMGSFLSDSFFDFGAHFGFERDRYASVKAHHNTMSLMMVNMLRPELKDHPLKWELALYLVTRSNWMDVVMPGYEAFALAFPEEINQLLDAPARILGNLQGAPLVQLSAIRARLEGPTQTILIECDNCGEVVFDLFLAELLLEQGHTVIMAGKEAPIVNDVTATEIAHLVSRYPQGVLREPLQTGRLRVIGTGSAGIGKLLDRVSTEYRHAYQQADILVLKGQGNFHTMPFGVQTKKGFVPHPYQKPIISLMGLKSPIILRCMQSLYAPRLLPPMQSPVMMVFDPQNPATFPIK